LVFSIAVAGKGGTGKTTIAALLISRLDRVLAIDADANSNLNEVLGVKVDTTIGKVREKVLENPPNGMTKQEYLKYQLHRSLVESDNFDLLVMGRPEGPGCYCYANHLIRMYIDVASADYNYVVMDNEAGLEHLSRRTTNFVDILLIVSDPSCRGIETAARVRDLAKEMDLKIGKIYFIVNRVVNLDGGIKQRIAELGLDLISALPENEEIKRYDFEGVPLVQLPDTNPVVREIIKIKRLITGS
jgi:CO dehydrogenase maturation factor